MLLGMNWYIRFTEKEIIINSLWELKEVRYKYSEIMSLQDVESKYISGKKTFTQEYIEIKFDDGRAWASNEGGRTPNPLADRRVLDFLSRKSGKNVIKVKK